MVCSFLLIQTLSLFQLQSAVEYRENEVQKVMDEAVKTGKGILE